MPLTPDDIQEKFFRTALRGYHLEEVDEFLDEVALSLKEYEELLADRDRIIAEIKNQPPAGEGEAAGVLSEARAEARRIIDEAQESASQLVSAARREAAEASTGARPAASSTDLSELDRRRERAAQLMLAEIERYRIVMSVVKSTVTGLPGAMDDHMAELDAAAAQIRGLL
ncbi:MAG: DivIVA domain-containing protein [bacterium]|nr:DivIVA domain-containing protein [bacterium]MDE0233440.1 DivIVA domain-containing protein [bacterium]MDE0235250.1 DivIVA domain-containing protein [bacterium]